jgi:hypothetical protein
VCAKLNPKSEIRKPKQNRNFECDKSETASGRGIGFRQLFTVFPSLRFVSDFEIRISDLPRRFHGFSSRFGCGVLASLLFASDCYGAGAGLGQENVTVDEKTAAVLKGTLKYLASEQQANGSWTEHGEKYVTAMTGYTLLAFMATGNLPGEGEYGKVVANGARYLADSVQADGAYETHRTGQYMYGHGVATIALAELYGQTKSAEFRVKLEKAVKIILGSQNAQGGWRYNPRVGDADISVTVLQVVALRAAKNGGIDVPQESIDRAVAYVQNCYDDGSGGFCYQPRQHAPGFARTAAAIYSLQVCGRYDDPKVAAGAEYLQRETRIPGSRHKSEWFAYGHFYAAPAMYMIGGETWEKWYSNIKRVLLETVKRKDDTAYWDKDLDPRAPGPVYVTAVFTTVLSMPYHYMPLYQR